MIRDKFIPCPHCGGQAFNRYNTVVGSETVTCMATGKVIYADTGYEILFDDFGYRTPKKEQS
jgi:hypothetical protein